MDRLHGFRKIIRETLETKFSDIIEERSAVAISSLDREILRSNIYSDAINEITRILTSDLSYADKVDQSIYAIIRCKSELPD